MKKIKLLSILALSTVVLGACSVFSNQSSEASSDNKENTEQVEKKDEAAEVKEKVTKDAEILLDSFSLAILVDLRRFMAKPMKNGLKPYLQFKQVKKSKKKVFHLRLPTQYNGTKISL